MKKRKIRESNLWKRFVNHKIGAASAIIVLILALMAIFAPLIASYDPNAINPAFLAPPSAQHWLGTDAVGRDVFSRLLYATRVSLSVGVLATVITTSIGIVLGLISGYFGGIPDMIIMRITDMVMSFPYMLLVLVAAAVFKPGLMNVILILGFLGWPGVARIVRGNVLSIRESGFVKSSQVAGMSKKYILFSEILPNAIAPVLVFASSMVSMSILDEAALSFLGMGVQPPTASLGNMLGDAQSLTVLTNQPWLWVPPGVVIVVLVVAISFIGDALQDGFNPVDK